ncbi:MAG: glycosyltransferase family 1 protein [Chloroflexi bacterium HGW-Chloroflexi-2]|nr:MAG: glycosyltransferase family 1 protein [Chloroflexi bacterium HGW-Chloroflexi-2]
MNVAMLSYHTCPLATLGGKDTGGMNVYVHQLTRTLGKLGVRVDVFTRSQDEHVPHVLHDLGYHNRVVHIPAGPEVPLPKAELERYIPKFVQGIKSFAESKNIHYDLIHSHYWMSGLAAIELSQTWNIPFLHMFHTLVLMKNRIAQTPQEMEGEYRILGEKKVISKANRIIAATLAEKSQLEFLYKAPSSKISVIPPGVDTRHFYPIPKDEAKEVVGVPEDSHTILFVGRIEPLKGIDKLIQAISIIQNNGELRCCPHNLVIIGGEPNAKSEEMNAEMARLQDMVEDLGIENFVIFLGKQDQQLLPYYYSASEIVVMPSHYESFGMVALEAMACGTPVVASQVGGLAFLVRDGETGFVVPGNDVQMLAKRLVELIKDKDLRNKLGNKSAEYAQLYAWEIISEKMIEVYNQVLENHNSIA